ncbi:MAG: serine/threonine protein kinase [Myxococcales bacterium]|nr:serine/threonine protein kinase [Myxococcales bacterium]
MTRLYARKRPGRQPPSPGAGARPAHRRGAILAGPMEPLPFGKYLLVDRVAAGGMAEVYRALLRGPGGFEKTIALKRILPSFCALPEFVRRFMDEARLVAGLTHMNIAQVFDFGEVDGSYYLAMEFVEGVDLGRLEEAARRAGEPLGADRAAFIVAEAARGLAWAHARSARGRPLGIVHRDVSPQNILLSYAGEVKIADFGIAKVTAQIDRLAPQTSSGAMMGKLRYMSPEQITGEPLDGRSDLFALGVVLHEALTGCPLVDGDNPAAVVDQVKRAQFPPPSARAPGVPAELDRIVLKALARDREARYERAADLARDLTLFLGEHAPGFSREDLGAFVLRVAPRRPFPTETEDALDDGDGEPRSPALADTERDQRRLEAPREAGPPRGAATTTRLDPPAQRRGNRQIVGVALITLAVGVVGGAALVGMGEQPIAVAPRDRGAIPVPVSAAHDASRPSHDAAIDPLDLAGAARRAQLLAALKATPREDVTRRGVASSPEYRVVMSAVDAALCSTPTGSDDPVFPAGALESLRKLALQEEATALARYLLVARVLPPEVDSALLAMLAGRPAYLPGATESAGYAVAALASLTEPASARFAIDLLRQQGAHGRWRDPTPPSAPGRHPDLCERLPAVERLARLAPDARFVQLLRRYLQAAPARTPANDHGVRYTVIGAERDPEAARLTLVIRVTNATGEPAAMTLRSARLAGAARVPAGGPALDPDFDRLPANNWREVKMTFEDFDDQLAESAVLVLPGGAELQAYSEVLR